METPKLICLEKSLKAEVLRNHPKITGYVTTERSKDNIFVLGEGFERSDDDIGVVFLKGTNEDVKKAEAFVLKYFKLLGTTKSVDKTNELMLKEHSHDESHDDS